MNVTVVYHLSTTHDGGVQLSVFPRAQQANNRHNRFFKSSKLQKLIVKIAKKFNLELDLRQSYLFLNFFGARF